MANATGRRLVTIAFMFLGLVMSSLCLVEEIAEVSEIHDVETFTLTSSDCIPPEPYYSIELVCENGAMRSFPLLPQMHDILTTPHGFAGQRCSLRFQGQHVSDLGTLVMMDIFHEGRLLARRLFLSDGNAISTGSFVMPEGGVEVHVTQALANKPIGTRLRVMEWNIWQGGREAGGEANIGQLIEFIREQNPDVLFVLETYGTGDRILRGLNSGLPTDQQFTGVRITNRPHSDRDNLWIYSRYPVIREYPAINELALDSANFGGIMIALPDGQRVNLFNTWLWHADWAWGLTNAAVTERAQGAQRTHTDAELVASDLVRRLEMARVILQKRLPGYLGASTDPVILAGDFNTMSYADWSLGFADAPGHGGLVLPWPVTQLFEEAGFIDTYRWANPDAGRFPGSTWSPQYPGIAPGRIDYIWAKGTQIRVLDSFTLEKRLPGHENPAFPFYSDHAALISDLMILSDPVVIRTPAEDGKRLSGETPIVMSIAIHSDDVEAATVGLERIIRGEPVAGEVLFHGGRVPESMSLDTRLFEDGAYDLIVTVKAQDGHLFEASRRVVFSNWVTLEDALLPPQIMAWFGAEDRTKTVERSDGWEHVGDSAHGFFGDADRLVPRRNSPEYLIWKLPSLREFRFTVYTQDELVTEDAVVLAVSCDGENWSDQSFVANVVERSPSGWAKLDLTATSVGRDLACDPAYVRFTHSPIDGEGYLQLGHVFLRGLRN